jgi:hypothetical protein
MNDYVHLTFNASSDNEQFIRTAASAFALRLILRFRIFMKSRLLSPKPLPTA